MFTVLTLVFSVLNWDTNNENPLTPPLPGFDAEESIFLFKIKCAVGFRIFDTFIPLQRQRGEWCSLPTLPCTLSAFASWTHTTERSVSLSHTLTDLKDASFPSVTWQLPSGQMRSKYTFCWCLVIETVVRVNSSRTQISPPNHSEAGIRSAVIIARH